MYRMKKTDRWEEEASCVCWFDLSGQFTSGNILIHFIVNVNWPRKLLSRRKEKIKQDVCFSRSSDMFSLSLSLSSSLSLSISTDHKYKLSRRRIAYLCFPEFNHSLICVFGLWYATHYSYVSEEYLFPVCKLLIEWHICSASWWLLEIWCTCLTKNKCTTVI